MPVHQRPLFFLVTVLVFSVLLNLPLHAENETRTYTISASDLVEYGTLDVERQRLIDHALELSGMGLGYQYGSANPAKGGMDCSGTIQFLLKDLMEIKNVPRQANHMYRWVWKNSRFHAVNSYTFDGFEWDHLSPGDLLFWSGTYDVDRDPPVTHVMLYLGTLQSTGEPVMFGASSGRRYQGEIGDGVSVFDFTLPSPDSSSRFLGYGPVPNQAVSNMD